MGALTQPGQDCTFMADIATKKWSLQDPPGDPFMLSFTAGDGNWWVNCPQQFSVVSIKQKTI
jgi:hypothetical protein